MALQHNIGLGGAVVVTLYRLGFPQGGRSESFYIGLGQTSLLNCTTALVHASFRLELDFKYIKVDCCVIAWPHCN